MPIDFECLGVLLSEESEIGITLQRLREVNEISIGFRNERNIGQTWAEALGNLERSRALGNFFVASIRKFYMNAFGHDLGPVRNYNPSFNANFSLKKRLKQGQPNSRV
jgi:hypothetical protein